MPVFPGSPGYPPRCPVGRRGWLAWVVACLALLPSACSTLGYYAQSISGQVDVMNRRQPIETVVHDAGTAPELKDRLHTVLAIRHFASEQLALPDNGSYTSYADLERAYVVWNVFAAPELSMDLKEWCFPFAGCVSYRGYFAEDDAIAYADALRARGYDTYVGGVSAYSTLGWFSDPVLSTVIGYSDARLAGLIFHELAHQQLYVSGDTEFNEGFAVTVELEGVLAWLRHAADPVQAQAYYASRDRRDEFFTLVAAARERLLAVYAADITPEAKRSAKHGILAEMRAGYAGLRQAWGGYDAYDAWFTGGLNNAKLAAANTYREYVPLFRQLFAREGEDFAAFYAAVAEIGRVSDNALRLEHLRAAAAGKPGAVAVVPAGSAGYLTGGVADESTGPPTTGAHY